MECARIRLFVPAIAALFFFGPGAVGQLHAQADVPTADTTATATETVAPESPQPGQLNIVIGYNLKVTLRLAPVYEQNSLTSPIIEYLPQNSVVGVLEVQDNWYRIAFGAGDERREGWVISYGVERTHELEHLVTTRVSAESWQGQRLQVVSGESTVRAFPAANAQMLTRVYRGEILDITGEAEQFYRVVLPDGMSGWIWKGDAELYVQPRYSTEEAQNLRTSAARQAQRQQELTGLIEDLHARRRDAEAEIEILRRIQERREMEAAAEAARLQMVRPSIWNYDSLKARTSVSLGFANQKFGADLGLAAAMLKGLGLSFKLNEKLALDFSWSVGTPTVQALGEDDEIPVSLAGLDTLNLDASIIRFGLVRAVDASAVPLLRMFDNSARLGLELMNLEASAAGLARSRKYWGPFFGWSIGKRLFSRLSFDAGLDFFVTSAEVTNALGTGRSLMQRETRMVVNRSLRGGVKWRF